MDLVKDPALPLTKASTGKGDATRGGNNAPLPKCLHEGFVDLVYSEVADRDVVVFPAKIIASV